METIIQTHETKDWLNDYPHCHGYLLQGYKEAISDMTDNLLLDPRSSKNFHVLNDDFINTPAYFMGVNAQPEKRLLILSCLYVFPGFRGRKLSSHLLNTAKHMVQDKAAIQVAIEEHKIDLLAPFYQKHDFQTTGTLRKNSIGKGYIDYFWSGKKIELIDGPTGTIIKPIN